MIADTVFQRGETRILGLKTENVPGIDESAAIDAAAKQVFDLGK